MTGVGTLVVVAVVFVAVLSSRMGPLVRPVVTRARRGSVRFFGLRFLFFFDVVSPLWWFSRRAFRVHLVGAAWSGDGLLCVSIACRVTSFLVFL